MAKNVRARLREKMPTGVIPAVAYLIIFLIVPFFVLVIYSFLTVDGGEIVGGLTLDVYRRLLTSPFTYHLFLRTFMLAATTTGIALILGYPVAYLYNRSSSTTAKIVILACVMAPFMTSQLVRTFGWMVILGRYGLMNNLLMDLGVIESPISVLYSMRGIYVGMIQVFLPFMVVPLISTLSAINIDPEHAARDLGASRWDAFWRVVVPQSVPGIAAGVSLTFILTYTAFTVPTLMGGGAVRIVSVFIWNNIDAMAWDTSAGYASLLLVSSLVILTLFNLFIWRIARWAYL